MPLDTAAAPTPAAELDSLYALLVAGGPLMVPIALCSVVALAYAVERAVRLAPAALGSRAFARSVVDAARGAGPERALELCRAARTPLARILGAGLERRALPFLERDKAVEDVAELEVRRLGANLRPLLLVWLVAPLLGLLGTVWGMIQAFGEIATSQGLGRPELLASGIYVALVTTAAGLSVSIPAVVAHHHLRGRIEAFARRTEEAYRELEGALLQRPGVAA